MKLLAIVFSEAVKTAVQAVVKADSIHWLSSPDQFFAEVDGYNDGQWSAVVCELKGTPEFALEVGQVMRSTCSQTPSFICATEKDGFAPKSFIKNGFTDAFLFPIDKQTFIDSLSAALAPEVLSRRAYKRILGPDMQPPTRPHFTTYVHLPLNNKYLVYSAKDEPFSQKKVEKLSKFNVSSLFIDQKDSAAFYEYVAENMKDADNTLSATEREEKVRESVRGMFRNLFDQEADASFEGGKELMESCRKVVSSYILGSSKEDFHSRLLKTIGGLGMDYGHAADVSTLAALFGMGLGSKKIEELAIAGFFHDVALASFPEDYGYEVNPAWSEDLKKVFLEHPQQSLNLVKNKKMILPPEVEKMIYQHHEKYSGKGFPKGVSSDRILFESQILSLADQFHYLTSSRPGQQRHKPLEALDAIEANGSISKAIMTQARGLFASDKKAA